MYRVVAYIEQYEFRCRLLTAVVTLTEPMPLLFPFWTAPSDPVPGRREPRFKCWQWAAGGTEVTYKWEIAPGDSSGSGLYPKGGGKLGTSRFSRLLRLPRECSSSPAKDQHETQARVALC